MTSERYDPAAVEAKWQAEWERRGTNRWTESDLRRAKDPYYNLMMFPYPSAEGLHIGNLYAYTGADVNGRFWRLMGKDVFEPMGFDAFGIHSENYALKVGKNPNDLIPANIANFTRVLKRFGGMFDWNHTVNSTSVDYYRWTQWVFLKLYNGGLVERRRAPVNWCPSCMTVLANEQVIQGLCERCDNPVEQRELPQWFFRITDYASRLLDNLETIDWSDNTKKAQANWIGRSEGAEVDFAVSRGETAIRVFTTRPDTLFGATYMVLAPEHALVDELTTPEQRAASRSLSTRRHQAGPGRAAEGGQGQDRRLHGQHMHQPGQRCRSPRVDRRLRPHGLRHGRHHGGARPRPSRLRVRRAFRPAGDPRDCRARLRRRHPVDRGLRRRRPPRQLGRIRRPVGRRWQARDHRVARSARARYPPGQLSTARLVRVAAALLGPADSDHPLPSLWTRSGA